ncbi:MAG: STAS domain-containing protein [Actinobacteria bacterium]|nr:STAS domain-containing protein [Actinomycetota bacterium]
MMLDDHFSLGFSRAFGKVIVHIHGRLDADTAQELKDRLVDVIDGQGNRQLVVDLRGMTLIDTAGLSVLVDASERLQTKGGELVLSGQSSQVAHAFAAAGLDATFEFTPAWAHRAHGGARAHLGTSAGRRRSA